MLTSYSCKCCPLLVSIMAYCPGILVMAGHSMCVSVEGCSSSAHFWNICGFSEFLPQFSPLQNFPERFHLLFSFQIPTTCWWLPNLCLGSDFSECQPRPCNQLATSHPCPDGVSNHLDLTKNLLFPTSIIKSLTHWQKHGELPLTLPFFLKPFPLN